ncbi:uncharacterized protein LOC120792685 isoform X2 [Xiphias gladius]|uniref:uncharacterized protein LOC120792685 isoform X2 n=1 Tax=Xiphias gladius TaxID=8245 RepID=UPI001A99575C|nr:uncharacterized protein LOC120792685 isoform X2 [Xiphias gladius]
MEGRELQADNTCLQRFPKLLVWIIEYVWAHEMMDIQEVVDPSDWPEVDSQALSIEDSWRLRVASAQVYSIVKNRDMEHFERVMGFLEATYRLLPRLAAPMKHMKIMFGLKTMVIMWMLRERRGMVDTVFKITQFFPSKLSQYQDQCNQHEMFLMRKHNLDFKALAQALAMDKDKLDDYIKKQMEKQYGEHYAQKVEDRLLHYLHELETVLPGDTFIDKILKKDSPVTEEEQLLLEVFTLDSMTIAKTVRKLLHHGVASCRPAMVSQSSENGENEIETSQLSKSFKGGEEASQEVSKDSPLLWEKSNSHVRRHQKTNEDGEFCSRHQRWVNSILQECPDECSEELLLQANVSLSPPLFQSSSSSTSSSQDLTPSDLIPCPSDQQDTPSQTTTHPQTAAQVSDQANPKDKQSSGSASNTSQTESLPQPSSRDNLLPTLLSPVVRLVDIASFRKSYPIFKPHQASANHFMSSNKQAASASSPQVLTSPHCHTSRNKDSAFDLLESVAPTNPPNTTYKLQTASVSHDTSAFTSCQKPTLRSFSRLSRKLKWAFTATRHSRSLDVNVGQNPSAEQFKKAPATFQMSYLPLHNCSVSWTSIHDASTSASQSGILSSFCTSNQIPSSTKSSRQIVPQNSIEPHPQTHNMGPFQSKTLPYSTVISSTSKSDCLAVRSETCRVRRAQPRLSLPSQAVLLHSTLLQPYVSLTRLSAQECYQVTMRRSSARHLEPMLQGSNGEERKKKEEEDSDSSFDLNTLYTSHSSSSDTEDSFDCDPDYKPCI